MDQREAVCDGLEARRLGHQGPVGVDVGAVHDARQEPERRVLQSVLEHDRLEAAAAVNVAEFHLRHVVGDRPLALGD